MRQLFSNEFVVVLFPLFLLFCRPALQIILNCEFYWKDVFWYRDFSCARCEQSEFVVCKRFYYVSLNVSLFQRVWQRRRWPFPESLDHFSFPNSSGEIFYSSMVSGLSFSLGWRAVSYRFLLYFEFYLGWSRSKKPKENFKHTFKRYKYLNILRSSDVKICNLISLSSKPFIIVSKESFQKSDARSICGCLKDNFETNTFEN